MDSLTPEEVVLHYDHLTDCVAGIKALHDVMCSSVPDDSGLGEPQSPASTLARGACEPECPTAAVLLPPKSATPTSQNKTPSPVPQTSPLLDLPAELRVKIFYLAVKSDNEHIDVDKAGHARSALLRTCKQIHSEAWVIFYQANEFQITIRDFDSTAMLRWYQATHRDWYLKFLHVAGSDWNPDWPNLLTWAKRYCAGEVYEVPTREADCPAQYVLAMGVIALIFKTGRANFSDDWPAIEAILAKLRLALIVLDKRWADN